MNQILSPILFSLWFFIPAGVANVVPIFAANIPIIKKFSYPVDCYKSIGGIRILGNNKTIRGFITGILFGILVAYLQSVIPFPIENDVFKTYNPFLLGLLLSSGALVGDGVKSFFKRRIGIKSGRSWLLADQLDYIFGAIIFTLPVLQLHWYLYIFVIIEWFFIHILSTYIGYKIKLKKSPI